MRRFRLQLSVFVVAALSFVTSGRAETWQRYTDPLTGTSAEVPTDRFDMLPARENGVGRVFSSDDGQALISIYGSVVGSGTPSSYESRVLANARHSGTRITYVAGGDGWFVFSGYQGPKIVYEKVVMSCRAPLTTYHVVIAYPTSERATYDPIVTHISRSLRHLNGPAC